MDNIFFLAYHVYQGDDGQYYIKGAEGIGYSSLIAIARILYPKMMNLNEFQLDIVLDRQVVERETAHIKSKDLGRFLDAIAKDHKPSAVISSKPEDLEAVSFLTKENSRWSRLERVYDGWRYIAHTYKPSLHRRK